MQIAFEGRQFPPGGIFQPDAEDNSGYAIFLEEEEPDLARAAWQLQGERYLEWGIVKADALEPDGSLPAEIDRMRGDSTRYILRQGYEDILPGQDAWPTTIRIRSPSPGCSYMDLPSYERCEDKLYPGSAERLAELAMHNTIEELGAFGGAREASALAMHAVFRRALERVLAAPDSHIIWKVGMVTNTYARLSQSYGSDNIEVIGHDTLFDPRVILPIKPGLMYPNQFIDRLMNAYLGAEPGSTAQNRLHRSLLFFTKRLGSDQMSEEAWYLQNALRQRGHEGGV